MFAYQVLSDSVDQPIVCPSLLYLLLLSSVHYHFHLMAKFVCCGYCICAGCLLRLLLISTALQSVHCAYQDDKVVCCDGVGATSLDTGQCQSSNQGQCSRGCGQDALQHAPSTAPGPSPACLAKYVYPPCLPCLLVFAHSSPFQTHVRPTYPILAPFQLISAHLSSTLARWGPFVFAAWGLQLLRSFGTGSLQCMHSMHQDACSVSQKLVLGKN